MAVGKTFFGVGTEFKSQRQWLNIIKQMYAKTVSLTYNTIWRNILKSKETSFCRIGAILLPVDKFHTKEMYEK